MPTQRRCEKCGATLASFGAEALCPKCMLHEAVRLETGRPAQRPAASPGRSGTVLTPPVTEKPGDRIGRYKLLQQIGEGGMGVVYMAEQEEPVHRKVALKVIKLGMDTKSVIARFEAERQALALMDHPNIAKVFDAGATDAGRPYFVMELVRGMRITDYCDQHNLSTKQRLDLFTQVCRAIQHAHQKGIIHRDIKSSNILVTLHDRLPVLKVIDFGIAKATSDQRLTDKTLFTAFEQFLGTPAYMSPEQAGLGGLDIDTRSDIYSLGVLLYELLTGQTPFDATELGQAGLDEMRRTIREREAPKPSTRLIQELAAAEARRLSSNSPLPTPHPALEEASSRRLLQIKALIPQVRGDLDWIVMKALEKDRTRRYESANGLTMDIQRHLANEPVVARPPSATYRFQKLVRRNKIAIAAVSAVAVALIIGLVSSTWLFLREEAAASKSETVAQFLKGMLKSLNPALAQGRHVPILHEILDKTTERVATELTSQPEIQAELDSIIGNAYYELEDFSKADALYREGLRVRRAVFGETHRLVAASLNDLGNALTMEDRQPEGERLQRQALAMRRKLFGNEHAEVANSLACLADTLTDQRKLAEAETLQREALAMQRRLLGDEHPDVSVSLNNLGRILRLGGRLAEAESVYREVLALTTDKQNPAFGDLLIRLARVLRNQGKLAEAELLCREALAMSRRLLGNENKIEFVSFNELNLLLLRQGKLAEIEALFSDRLQGLQERLPADDAKIIGALGDLNRILVLEGKFPEAEQRTRESLGLLETKLPDDWRTFNSRSLLGGSLLGQKKYDDAEPYLLTGYQGMKQREDKIPDAGKPYFKEALQRLVQLYQATGRPDQAAEWKHKLEAFDPPAPATNSVVDAKQR